MKKNGNYTLTESEIKRMERRRAAAEYAKKIIKECQQQGFTVAQFEVIVERLDFRCQILKAHAADITRMGD